jgi:hypothetical protein
MKQKSSSYIKKGILIFLYYESYETYEAYLLDKIIKTPFIGKLERSSEFFKIHIDVCGPIMIDVIGGYMYFITYTNDYSRYGYVYLMKHKFQSF